MLSNGGLNTHSNRISKNQLKEDGKKSTLIRKTEFRLNRFMGKCVNP